MASIKYNLKDNVVTATFYDNAYNVSNQYGRNLFVEQLKQIMFSEIRKSFKAIICNGLYIDESIISNIVNRFVNHYGFPIGVAKCSPEDTFDAEYGKKLARRRLLDKNELLMIKFYQHLHDRLTKIIFGRLTQKIDNKIKKHKIRIVKDNIVDIIKEGNYHYTFGSKPLYKEFKYSDDLTCYIKCDEKGEYTWGIKATNPVKFVKTKISINKKDGSTIKNVTYEKPCESKTDDTFIESMEKLIRDMVRNGDPHCDITPFIFPEEDKDTVRTIMKNIVDKEKHDKLTEAFCNHIDNIKNAVKDPNYTPGDVYKGIVVSSDSNSQTHKLPSGIEVTINRHSDGTISLGDKDEEKYDKTIRLDPNIPNNCFDGLKELFDILLGKYYADRESEEFLKDHLNASKEDKECDNIELEDPIEKFKRCYVSFLDRHGILDRYGMLEKFLKEHPAISKGEDSHPSTGYKGRAKRSLKISINDHTPIEKEFDGKIHPFMSDKGPDKGTSQHPLTRHMGAKNPIVLKFLKDNK